MRIDRDYIPAIAGCGFLICLFGCCPLVGWLLSPTGNWESVDKARTFLGERGHIIQFQRDGDFGIRIEDPAFGDSDLATLAAILREFPGPVFDQSRLIELNLSGTAITDSGLKHLEGVNLSVLMLADTKVGDAGIESMPWLYVEELFLNGTRITDRGVRSLCKLPIGRLGLERTAITDASLPYLESMQEPIMFSLKGSKISKAGLDRLSKVRSLESW